jgi:hypothetical protein
MRKVSLAAAISVAFAIGCTAAQAADAVKSGKWEFTSQVQMPAMPQPPAGASPPAGAQPGTGGVGTSRTMCVEPDKAVPTDPRPECKTERVTRNGGTINWSTTCTTPRGPVRSEGVAHYRGDTMEASLTTHIPQADGRAMDTRQHITGRYLGPCGR